MYLLGIFFVYVVKQLRYIPVVAVGGADVGSSVGDSVVDAVGDSAVNGFFLISISKYDSSQKSVLAQKNKT